MGATSRQALLSPLFMKRIRSPFSLPTFRVLGAAVAAVLLASSCAGDPQVTLPPAAYLADPGGVVAPAGRGPVVAPPQAARPGARPGAAAGTPVLAESARRMPVPAPQALPPRPEPPRPAPPVPNLPAFAPGAGGGQTTYTQVPMQARYVALTFDDGPHGSLTPRLLDILAQFNAKATFFVVGPRVAENPGIVRRMVAEGHEVGNHTWSHPQLTRLESSQGRAAVQREIQRTTDAIVSACGQRPVVFRPPYGAFNQSQRAWCASELGMPTILWDVDPEDWRRPGAGVVTNRLVSGASPGSILLVHDIHEASVNAIPETLRRLQAQGYRFVTVSQLLRLQGSNLAGVVPAAQPGLASETATVTEPETPGDAPLLVAPVIEVSPEEAEAQFLPQVP